MNRTGIRIFGQLCVMILVSCTADQPREPIKGVSPISNPDSLRSPLEVIEPNGSTRTRFLRRTVTTKLSQDSWPSTDGNEVQIYYRDSVSSDINVIIYGETGRTEYTLFSLRERVSRGTANTIVYKGGSIYDNLPKIEEDTCSYRFEISRDGKLTCKHLNITRSNDSVECETCFQYAHVLTELIHDVEILVARNSH